MTEKPVRSLFSGVIAKPAHQEPPARQSHRMAQAVLGPSLSVDHPPNSGVIIGLLARCQNLRHEQVPCPLLVAGLPASQMPQHGIDQRFGSHVDHGATGHVSEGTRLASQSRSRRAG